ncbi:MAG: S8 family peptidase [Bacteroidales bacterium]|jgi:hypothetical protein|nr:S8 family peptidase [Bacteroidales bacterium]
MFAALIIENYTTLFFNEISMKPIANFRVFLLSSFCFLFFGAVAYGQTPNCYRITFSDKNDSPFSISRPEEFLSERAIAKRERFSIPIIEQDLPVNPQYIDLITNFFTVPTQIISISKWNNSVVIFFFENENYQDIIDEMVDNFSFIESVIPVAAYSWSNKIEISIHEQFSQAIVCNSSCDYNYGMSLDNINIHRGHSLHKAGFCGEDMLICVFDAGWNGFNTLSCFQSLYNNGQIWGERDLAPGVNNVYTGHGHGTAVTSEMATEIDGQMVGTAPKANYFFIRSEYPWSEQLVEEDFWAQAAELADSLGADVATASLGYTNFDFPWQNIYTIEDNNGMASIASRAASILTQKGVIVVNSAGNEGNKSWHYIGRPADAFNILAVGAVNKDGEVALFSSYGPTSDERVKPDVASVGWNAWVVAENGYIVQTNGTSMAAPIIAGLSACLWQALPQFSSLELMDLIRKYSDQYNNPNDRTGYGIPNFYQCYLDHYIGVRENKVPEFSVFPNPTTGQLVVSSEYRVVSIEIIDIYGRNLLSHTPLTSQSQTLINISHLTAGVYFLKIYSNRSFEVIKVVKKS